MRARIIALALLISSLALGVWSLYLEPRSLVVQRVTLTLPRWAPEHRGLRVALLSDLHVGSPHWGVERMGALVAQTNAERPDLVLLAGDYLINRVKFGTYVSPEEAGETLGGLRAELGVIAVLGNHDWWNDGPAMRAALERHGVIVLENEHRALSHRGRDLTVVGLADELTRPQRVRESVEEAGASDSVLALVHEPDVFPQIPASVSLTLAGHTHGGQVNLPLLGRRVVPSRYGERYAYGHVVEDGRHLFVTSGVGTSIFPVRLGVPPELVILTLQ